MQRTFPLTGSSISLKSKRLLSFLQDMNKTIIRTTELKRSDIETKVLWIGKLPSRLMNFTDTIVALSTPSGEGAIGVIRLSGSKAMDIVASHTGMSNDKLSFGRFRIGDQVLDEVVVSRFQSPKSYTGEDVCEISFHGSSFILNRAMEALIESGARLAEPGEFTQRAFLNGKMDLSQAEAVADLIASESAAEHRLAMHQMRGGFSREIQTLREELIHFASLIELELDFGEEDVEFAERNDLRALIEKIQSYVNDLIDSFRFGNAIKQGVPVAIIGKPNAGKSTLLNALLNDDKAIVSEIAGTTRDSIEDIATINGVKFRFIDTAGIRETSDQIEAMGVERSLAKMKQAAIVIYLFDSRDDQNEHLNTIATLKAQMNMETTMIAVANKCDISESSIDADLKISAKNGQGLNELNDLLSDQIKLTNTQSHTVVTNTRHLQALKATKAALTKAYDGLDSGLSGDLLAADIRESLHHLGSITGEITTEDLLGNIFGKFCIGK